MAQSKARTNPAPTNPSRKPACIGPKLQRRRKTGDTIVLVALAPEVARQLAEAARRHGVDAQVADDVQAVPALLERFDVRLVVAGRSADHLMPMLRDAAPAAQAMLVDPSPSVTQSIAAFRSGFLDYLGADDLADTQQLADRVLIALDKQRHMARNDRRLARLRSAVRKLNSSRKEVGKRVDVLCNDLISAYGDLARQMDTVRLRQEFGTLLDDADDLEQLLCHTMDWILKRMGHCNIAIYLTNDHGQPELGAYMKYTVPGDRPLTEALAKGLVKQVQHRGYVHADGASLPGFLTQAELPMLHGQAVLASDCPYLAESLATIVCFRDARKPFTAEDREALECAAGPFAQVLTTLVHDEALSDWPHVGDDAFDDQALDAGGDDDFWPGKKEDDRHAADWWKTGEEPPF